MSNPRQCATGTSIVCAMQAIAFLWIVAMVWPNVAVADATETAASDPEPVIATGDRESTDTAIATRLQAIFKQIDALAEVAVQVRSGVVTLGGKVANQADAQRAEALAIRVQGVVAVEDDIDRTLAIEENVEPLLERVVTSAQWAWRAFPLLLLAIVVFAAISFLAYRLSTWRQLWRRISPNPFLADLISQAVRVVGVASALIIALSLLGATTLLSTILGGVGIIGLAIGFSIRDSLGNYISSVMLSVRQPFRANDLVCINEHEGVVVRLTSRATILMTPDGNQLRIPNADVFKATILNYTRNPQRRFTFTLGVDADDDPLLAIECGLGALNELEFVLAEPAPVAKVEEVGDSNILIWFAAWIDQRTADFAKSRSVAISVVKHRLQEQGFSLPEPIYRLRIDGLGSVMVPREVSGASSESESDNPVPQPTATPDQTGSLQPDPVTTHDVTPDSQLDELVASERQRDDNENFLDAERPVE